jgi:hypothetical protein
VFGLEKAKIAILPLIYQTIFSHRLISNELDVFPPFLFQPFFNAGDPIFIYDGHEHPNGHRGLFSTYLNLDAN